jgi:hypothetical protein
VARSSASGGRRPTDRGKGTAVAVLRFASATKRACFEFRNRTATLTARYRPFRDAIGQLQPVACSKRASVSGRSPACGRLDTYLSHFINLAKRNQAAIASCLEAAAKAKKEQY